MPIYKGINVAFVHIPKNAGTSVAWALHEQNLKTAEVTYEESKHETIMQIKNYYPDTFFDNAFKVSIVRNPWDRLVSWYTYYKKSWEDGTVQEKPCSIEHIDEFLNMDFSSWVKKLKPFGETSCLACVPCPFQLLEEQWKYIVDYGNFIMVDYIMHTESLDNDWKTVCERIGIEHKELLTTNKTERKDYRSYYDEETENIVGNLYKKDIEHFGYYF